MKNMRPRHNLVGCLILAKKTKRRKTRAESEPRERRESRNTKACSNEKRSGNSLILCDRCFPSNCCKRSKRSIMLLENCNSCRVRRCFGGAFSYCICLSRSSVRRFALSPVRLVNAFLIPFLDYDSIISFFSHRPPSRSASSL